MSMEKMQQMEFEKRKREKEEEQEQALMASLYREVQNIHN